VKNNVALFPDSEILIHMNKVKVSIAVALLIIAGFAYRSLAVRNLEEIKAHSVETFDNSNFKIIGYEGYTLSLPYGANVWYVLARKNNDYVTYDACVIKWGNEYQIVNLKSINTAPSTDK
jgi:hypothetical protein